MEGPKKILPLSAPRFVPTEIILQTPPGPDAATISTICARTYLLVGKPPLLSAPPSSFRSPNLGVS